MLITPLNIFFEGRPSKPFSFLKKEHVGVDKKTFRNFINGKHSLQKKSIETICCKIAGFAHDVPGLEIDVVVLRDMLSSPPDSRKIPNLNFLKDSYTQYYRRILMELLDLDRRFSVDFEMMRKRPLSVFMDSVSRYPFPPYMFKDNLVEGPDLIRCFEKTVNRIRADILLYLFSAYDVEHNHFFYKEVNGDKPLMAGYLPEFKNGKIRKPIEIWFDRIMKKYEYDSINEFAKFVPQLTVNPKNKNEQSQIRMMRKWRSGEVLPSFETIDCIFEKIAKKDWPGEDTEYIKETGRLFFFYVRLFQILLNGMQRNPQQYFGFDQKGIVNFFERYLHWHNYHSVNFESDCLRSQPNDG